MQLISRKNNLDKLKCPIYPYLDGNGELRKFIKENLKQDE